jgi:hypothetical protein
LGIENLDLGLDKPEVQGIREWGKAGAGDGDRTRDIELGKPAFYLLFLREQRAYAEPP